MEYLNNDISDAALIRSLCPHNKRHIQEIDRLQTLNKELDELVDDLRTKLEATSFCFLPDFIKLIHRRRRIDLP